MRDADLTELIERLEGEERRLRRHESQAARAGAETSVSADAERLGEIRVELDVLWDLMRRRRAARTAGADPQKVQPRDAAVVERYLS